MRIPSSRLCIPGTCTGPKWGGGLQTRLKLLSVLHNYQAEINSFQVIVWTDVPQTHTLPNA